MKVGLLDSRAARLHGYWAAYLKELGVEVVTPSLPDAEALGLGQKTLPGEALPVQLALGRILALDSVDAVLLPQWAPVQNDAWSEALGELLSRRISGLPALIPVPDSAEGLEGAAAEVGLRVSQNAGRVRLALERARIQLPGARAEMPPLSVASRVTVGVIGPRTLLAEELLSGDLRRAIAALGLHGVYSPELPLAEVLKRAERMEQADTAPAGERELFGAASLLSGKGAVRGLIFAAPARNGAALAALERLAARQHKPTLLLTVDAGAQPGAWPDLEAFRDRITLGERSQEQDA
ncbi:acyl-CoA dehydratase activase-related protein [Deinococcus hohokamensis]|uniref:Acyl-CoA dehydratase activase-related protein n=1 Tax=Deinococcus hohokamensis TaxID=309883 RepID=A0ABV9I9Y0_9DEIO